MMVWCDECQRMVWACEHMRWTLTQRGWCEAMGISSAIAEVLSGVDETRRP